MEVDSLRSRKQTVQIMLTLQRNKKQLPLRIGKTASLFFLPFFNNVTKLKNLRVLKPVVTSDFDSCVLCEFQIQLAPETSG